MSPIRKQLLDRIAEMTDRYPEWRFGQLVANLAAWACQPTELHDTGVWDVEDEELLTAVERHLAQATETAAR
jgi:hypothetical protein